MDRNSPDQAIVIARIPWSDTAEKHLSAVPVVDPTMAGVATYRRAVKEGKLALFGVFVAGVHSASMLCAVYENDNGSEFVIEALGGDDPHAGVMRGLPGIEQLAKQAGCKVIRMDTVRRGIVHIAEASGYELQEYILRKVI